MKSNIELAIEELKNGDFVLITDDHDRENEADLCLLAEHVTAKHVNFMINNARGLMCVPVSSSLAKNIGLQLMCKENNGTHKTAFTITIDAKEGITSGISSKDRAHTMNLLTKANIELKDFETPGHVFPLIANENLLDERKGHTEASIEMCILSKSSEVAVICETLNHDGEPLRGRELLDFSKTHNIRIISVKEILEYRNLHNQK